MTQYSNQSVMVGSVPIELGKWWIKNAGRREYDSVMFDPAQEKEAKGCLNLYEGMAIKPEKGSWKRTLRHIYQILCNCDAEKFKYVVKWFAWCIQNPGARAEVVIIFKGKQGAGKGFIFSQFTKIFGEHGFHISNRTHLTGQFNGYMRTCVFLFADEAYYPGDKEVEGALNQLISEEKIAVRAMHKDLVIGKNCLHIGMATNSEWVIPAAGDARRYFINTVDNKYAKNECEDHIRVEYFTKLWGEMDNGGREAMVYDLKQMNISDFHPRSFVPETEEYRKQTRMGMPKMWQTMRTFLDAGEFPGDLKTNLEYSCSSKSIRKHFDKYLPKWDHSVDIKLKEILLSLGCIKRRTGTGICWIFPELKEMRGMLQDKFKAVEFDDMTEVWVVTGEEF